MSALFYTEIDDSPVGPLLLAGDSDALHVLSFGVGSRPREIDADWKPDTKGVLFIFIAWPPTFIAFAWLWLQFVPTPWWVDAIALFVAVPVTFVVAGAGLALGSVIAKRA